MHDTAKMADTEKNDNNTGNATRSHPIGISKNNKREFRIQNIITN